LVNSPYLTAVYVFPIFVALRLPRAPTSVIVKIC
jgi:hypothetical protein